MTGTTADGRASSGKATLVKEAGAWKLDEDAWATPNEALTAGPDETRRELCRGESRGQCQCDQLRGCGMQRRES